MYLHPNCYYRNRSTFERGRKKQTKHRKKQQQPNAVLGEEVEVRAAHRVDRREHVGQRVNGGGAHGRKRVVHKRQDIRHGAVEHMRGGGVACQGVQESEGAALSCTRRQRPHARRHKRRQQYGAHACVTIQQNSRLEKIGVGKYWRKTVGVDVQLFDCGGIGEIVCNPSKKNQNKKTTPL
jgi:hypothetical protein